MEDILHQHSDRVNRTSQNFKVPSKIKHILQSLYQRFTNLEFWLRNKCTGDKLDSILSIETDEDGYKNLLRTTLVAVNADYKEVKLPSNLSQVSKQHDVVARSMKQVLQRHKGDPSKNVLSFGFGLMPYDSTSFITIDNNLEVRHQNSSVIQLNSPSWQTLLNRIGDSLMTHLLENTSIFVLFNEPAVYLQITGEPVYQLWQYSGGSILHKKEPIFSSQKVIPECSRDRSGIPSVTSRKRGRNMMNPSEVFTKISKKRKTNPMYCESAGRCAQAVSEIPKNCEIGGSMSALRREKRKAGSDMYVARCKRRKVCGDMTKETMGMTSIIPLTGQDVVSTVTEPETVVPKDPVSIASHVGNCADQERPIRQTTFSFQGSINSCNENVSVSISASSEGNDQKVSDNTNKTCLESCVFRPKLNHLAYSHTVVPCRCSNQSISNTIDDTVHIPRQGEALQRHPIAHTSKQRTVSTEQSSLNGAVVQGTIENATNSVAIVNDETVVTLASGAENEDRLQASKSRRQKKRLRQKRKREKQQPCTPGISAYRYHTYVPKLILLYGKCLREKFPPDFSLATFSSSKDGAASIFRDIFINGDIGGNWKENGKPCQCERLASTPQDNSKQTASEPHISDTSKFTDNSHTGNCSSLLSSQKVSYSQFQQEESGQTSANQSCCHLELKGKGKPSKRMIGMFSDLPGLRKNELGASAMSKTFNSMEKTSSADMTRDVHNRNLPTYQGSAIAETSLSSNTRECAVTLCGQGGKESDWDCESVDVAVTRFMLQSKPGNAYSQMHQKESEVTILESQKSYSAMKIGKGMTQEVIQRTEVNSVCSRKTESAVPQNSTQNKFTKPETVSQLQERMMPLLHKLLLNHRHCKYWAFLNHHCKSKFDVRKQKTARGDFTKRNKVHPESGATRGNSRPRHRRRNLNKEQPTAAQLLEDHIPPSKVFAFLKGVLKATIPSQLFDCAIFLKNIQNWVFAGKYEKICLGQVMKGMKVKSCEWLREVACQKEREHHMARLIWWTMVHFIVPLIKAFFYVTDTKPYRNRVFYYRKRTWLMLKTGALQQFKKAAALQIISKENVGQLMCSKQSLGVSVLRFMPTSQSVRAIVNMSFKPKPGTEQKQSINKQLTKLFQILKYEKKLDPRLCGCSVFGLDDVFLKLKQFKQQRVAAQDERYLYFVKSDINKCFDSVQQQRLFSVIQNVFTKENEQMYTSRKFCLVQVSAKRLKRVFHTNVARKSDFQHDFSCFLPHQCCADRLNNIVVVDQVHCQRDSSEVLLSTLSSHLFKNIIKVGERYFIQKSGISQGSVLSALLACIYLADLEAKYLSAEKDELLIRWIDDYLFLTPYKCRAQRFVDIMVKGFPEYNCFINVEKLVTNYPATHPKGGSIECTGLGETFPWCGLRICTSSLEVSVDYSRYFGLNIADTATYDTSYKAGQALNNKLFMCLKIRTHLIFFDPELNSQERILLNICQLFLFLARIFHCFILKMPSTQRVHCNPHYFFDTVLSIPRNFQILITNRLKKQQEGLEPVCHFPISLTVLHWINADAFLTRLHPNSEYKPLKKFLRSRRLFLQKKLGMTTVAGLIQVRNAAMRLDSDVVLF